MRKQLLLSRLMPFFFRLDEETRYNFKIDATSALLFGVFAGAFFPFFSVTAVRLGAASTLLALITAAPFMGQLFAIYWGHRSDQGQKKPYIVYSGFFSRLVLILLGLTHQPGTFALFIVVHFLLASIGGPAFTSLMRKIYPLQYRGQMMGRIQFVVGLVRVVITYLTGRLLDILGYTEIFIAAGIIGSLASLYFNRVREPQEEFSVKKNRFSLKVFFHLISQDRLLRYAILGFFIFDLGNLLLAPVYPVIQVQNLGLSNLQIGQLSIFWMLGWFMTAPIWGTIVDRYRPLNAVVISILLFMISPLIYYWSDYFPLLLAASFSGGAAGSSLEAGWMNLMMKLGGKRASQYSGLYLTVLGVRGLIGPLVGAGLLQLMEIRFLFLIAVSLLLLGLIPMLTLYSTENKIEGETKLVSRSEF